MRQRRRPAAGLAAGLASTLWLLTACPGAERSADPAPPPDAAPTTTAAPAIPSVAEEQPPDGAAPTGAHPWSTLRGAVDLSAVAPDVPLVVGSAVGTPDGGAFVVLTGRGREPDRYLATVGPVAGGGLGVVRAVQLPPMAQIWGTHLLGDGTVLLAGALPRPEGYGFAVVDPVTGAARSTAMVPYEQGTVLAFGRSALATDGLSLTLFVSTEVGSRTSDLLYTADVATGDMLAGRDLFEEVRPVSLRPVGVYSAGMVARPDGGVRLVFDAFPVDSVDVAVPTLLTYDAQLQPVGLPAPLTDPEDWTHAEAITADADGDLFVVVEELDGGWILTVPDGGPARRLVRLGGHAYDYGLVVDPERRWALLPAAEGARAIELATGTTAVVDVGCQSAQDVAELLPAPLGQVLLLGQCDVQLTRDRPMLWIVGS